jgi:hypothetical protein
MAGKQMTGDAEWLDHTTGMESRRTHTEFLREIIDSQWLVETLADYLDSANHPMGVAAESGEVTHAIALCADE